MTTATAVKERPIIFSSSMIRSILSGSKTQTRRVIKPQPFPLDKGMFGIPANKDDWAWPYPRSASVRVSNKPNGPDGWSDFCPYGKPGDRLWVRESWSDRHASFYPHYPMLYRADGYPSDADLSSEGFESFRWQSPIHMPRWASRLTLEITGIRVERLTQVSDEDATNEGIVTGESTRPRVIYANLWDSLNKKRGFSWESDPWVWVLEFRRVLN